MKRRKLDIDAILSWVIILEVLLGVAILVAGCKSKTRTQEPKMLQVTECDCTYWIDESQLYTLEDSVHFYEDGM